MSFTKRKLIQFMDGLEIRKDFDELYGEFGKLYEASMDKGYSNAKWEEQR